MKSILESNKKGQVGGIIGGILVVLVIVGLVTGLMLVLNKGVGGGSSGTSESCEVEPYLSVSLTDSINMGTKPTAGSQFEAIVTDSEGNTQLKTVTTGTSGTAFNQGDSLDVVVNATNYGAVLVEDFAITKCGQNDLSAELQKLDGTPTISIFNTDGDKLSDVAGGNTVNQSTSANTIVVNMDFTMPTDESATALVFVVEASNSTEVDKIAMGANAGTIKSYSKNKPDFLSTEGSLSDSIHRSFWAEGFNNDGQLTKFSISFEPESGITMGTGALDVYVNVFFPQAFVDVDGVIVYDIEDSNGVAQHIDSTTADYDFGVGVAV
tara:strand:- start:5907 stop:6875 length:969 start_codon:yes stop_codon:yes gene_type:complete